MYQFERPMPKLLPLLLATFIILTFSGTALAQACASEECTSCRTNNFYYVLAAAIIIFLMFFWWTNRHRVPKRPRQKKLDKKV
jgi:p-aminobenzoyl-glutamate transporter AbgT